MGQIRAKMQGYHPTSGSVCKCIASVLQGYARLCKALQGYFEISNISSPLSPRGALHKNLTAALESPADGARLCLKDQPQHVDPPIIACIFQRTGQTNALRLELRS